MDIKPTILLAEDHPVNAEVAEHIVRRLGYDVDLAENGFAVLEALERKNYPFVLMDLRMPGMDGFEAARRILNDFPPERRPMIAAMTADVTRHNEARCRDLGMVAFIAKPIDKKALADILQTYVLRGDAVRQGASGDGAATGLRARPDHA